MCKKCGCNTCDTDNTALMLNESRAPATILSEGLKHHIDTNRPLINNFYSAGSRDYFDLIAEARSLYSRGILEITNKRDIELLTETDQGYFGIYEGKKVPLDFPMLEEEVINENNLLKQAKLSSEEYQKAKKLKDFNKDDYEWNSTESLYVKEKKSKFKKAGEASGFDMRGLKERESDSKYNEGKFYITRNLGRGQGKALVGGYDLKRDKKLPPKVFKSYKDAQKEVEKLQRGGSMGGQMTAYIITDKDMNMLKPNGKKMFESVSEASSKYPDFDLNKNIKYQDTSISSGMWRYTGKEQGGKGVYRNLMNDQFLGFSSDDFDFFKKHLGSHFDISESLEERINRILEAKFKGKTVDLNKPTRGDSKKFKVYVNSGKKNADGSIKVKKVNFGHGGTTAKKAGQKTMKIRKSNPKARKAFRARHNCDNPGPKTMARYWSCKKW